jgi:hypothetical protein
MCITNLSGSPQTVKNVPWLAAGNWYDILDQNIFYASSTVIDSMVMPAFSARIYSSKPDSILSVTDNKISEMPSEFKLLQNYPNPFNPSTNINYQLPADKYVSLKVFDILGREVATLVNEFKKTGSYSVEWNGNNLPSGVYFYRLVASSNEPLQTKSYTETKKMILMK